VSGTAVTGEARVMGSMGVEADDVCGNGRPDLLITVYYQEGTKLFRNNGRNFFTDVSRGCGMYAPSWYKVGWGTALFDAQNDGQLDFFAANGHVYRNAGELAQLSRDGKPVPYAQLAQLFLGDGGGRFREVSAEAGEYFRVPRVGRGAAMGDYDNDGRMDLAINHLGDTASVLRNETATANHWIRLQLEGARHRNPSGSNRDAVGARVSVVAGGRTIVRHVKGGGSYASAHERRLLIGLGPAARVDRVEVRWPNAKAAVQTFGPLEADRSYKLVEGEAEAQPALCPPLKPDTGD
jgi:enediyne biosynthesis protein E4